MTNVRDQLYHRHRFPAEIIAEALWLYFRIPLSFRMVEDIRAAPTGRVLSWLEHVRPPKGD